MKNNTTYHIERKIPRIKSRGIIKPTSTEIDGIIKYYPTQGTFFFPETLGLIIGDYLDFFELTTKDTGDQYFCFISGGCPITGRKISQHKKDKTQQRLRRIGKADLSISLGEFNEWYLKLPLPSQIDKTLGYSRFYESKFCVFGQTELDGKITHTRNGVMMNLKPIQTGNSNIFAELGQIIPEWNITMDGK